MPQFKKNTTKPLTNISADFPIFKRKIGKHRLIYLDSASTSQKPRAVLDSLKKSYTHSHANIHRAIYPLGQESTEKYEKTRELTAKFINANTPREIIFTRNCTEAINLVAYIWGEKNIHIGDEILVSALEHHSNLIPWQELCKRRQATLKTIPLTGNLQINLSAYRKLLTSKTKLLAITGMSNVLGVIPPLEKIITLAHQNGTKVLIDGAQSVAHLPTDVRALNCDFLAFSSHKMLGPSGVGILYAKRKLLAKMPPFLFGGDMIDQVQEKTATYAEPPGKFEAGTPNIEGVIAFGVALQYLKKIGMKNIHAHETFLASYCYQKLQQIPHIKIYSPPTNCPTIISFNHTKAHPHDLADTLGRKGICLRAGQHCAEPLNQKLNILASLRVSFYIYNTLEDIDIFIEELKKAVKIFE